MDYFEKLQRGLLANSHRQYAEGRDADSWRAYRARIKAGPWLPIDLALFSGSSELPQHKINMFKGMGLNWKVNLHRWLKMEGEASRMEEFLEQFEDKPRRSKRAKPVRLLSETTKDWKRK